MTTPVSTTRPPHRVPSEVQDRPPPRKSHHATTLTHTPSTHFYVPVRDIPSTRFHGTLSVDETLQNSYKNTIVDEQLAHYVERSIRIAQRRNVKCQAETGQLTAHRLLGEGQQQALQNLPPAA